MDQHPVHRGYHGNRLGQASNSGRRRRHIRRIVVAAGALVALALIVFFFPKGAGHEGGYGPVHFVINHTEHDCLGLKRDHEPKYVKDAGTTILCFGWLTGRNHCFMRSDVRREAIEIRSCHDPPSANEILTSCSDCLREAAHFALVTDRDRDRAIQLCESIVREQDSEASSSRGACFNDVATSRGGGGESSTSAGRLQLCARLPSGFSREQCARQVARVVYRTEPENAVGICASITSPGTRGSCLSGLASDDLRAGKFDSAEEHCRAAGERYADECWGSVAREASAADYERALRACGDMFHPDRRDDCYLRVAIPVARVDVDLATRGCQLVGFPSNKLVCADRAVAVAADSPSRQNRERAGILCDQISSESEREACKRDVATISRRRADP